MSYTGLDPRFRSTVYTDVGNSVISNPAPGTHRIINRGGTLQVQDDTGLETAIGAGGTVDRISQIGHGFTAGQILYFDGVEYQLAQANTSPTAEIVGMVSRVIDVDTFELTLEGKIIDLSGLTAGEVYFLSSSVPGGITITEPTTIGYVSLPVGIAIATDVFYVRSSRGAVVGSTNARTEIALSNNTTTNVQDVSAYQAGELVGWVDINGTTDYKFFVSSPFVKNGAGTDYNISPQYVGDTPPVGFSMIITSGGTIRITLPNITGFVSAKIEYGLNVPAVGATFPLAIDSTLVQFSTLKAKDSNGFILQNSSGTQIASLDDSGNFNVKGNGQGIVPIGAVIAMTTMTNAMAIPSSGTSSFGWQMCDGAAVAGGSVLTGNVPDLNDGVFLRGFTSYGSTGGSATKTITANQIPALTITGSNTSSSVSGTVGGSDGTHTHSVIQSGSGAGSFFTIGGAQTATNESPFAYSGSTGSGHGHSFSLTAAAQTWTGSYVNASQQTFNVEPSYINVIYLIRVK
jgi:hypothetical protein